MRNVNVRKISLLVVVGLLAVACVALLANYLLGKDKLQRNSEINGVAVGGLGEAEARELLASRLAGVEDKPITVRAGEMDTHVVPAEIGLSADWERTVAQAPHTSLNPVREIAALFRSQESDVVSAVDEAAFAAGVDRVSEELSRPPRDAAVRIDNGEVIVDEPLNGQHPSREGLEASLPERWLDTKGVEVSAVSEEPAVRDSSAAQKDAATALSGPVVVRGREDVTGQIPLERMGEVITFVPEGDHLRSEYNEDAARAILGEALSETEVEMKNASFTRGGGEVIPSVDGVQIQWDSVMDGLEQRILGDEPREFDAAYEDEPATYTTEQAQQANFSETVSTFTTGDFSGPSGTNIALTAQLVDGAVVVPGQTFSLNGYTGPRGAAQGFVESGIILNGRADKAVGGGISQFATTLYNAAYFAGMEDVAHTPHSYYISRYPAGREATVFEGLIDLQFKNTSKNPVLISSWVHGNEITVEFKGVKEVEVESVSGGRWAPTQPHRISLSGDDCSPSSGAPGFTTSDTRIIRNLSGAEIARETQQTVYDPQPIVRCS
ncbi:VanW family protein [Corynebacterium megadyptis]|uniref:VanW family protein n=1 Tax=Corynebacterium megadyptis TaxID=2080514 RepID=UPI003F6F2B0D